MGMGWLFRSVLTNGKRPWSVKALRYLLTGAKKRTERKVGLGRGKLREKIRDSYFHEFRFGFVVGKLSVTFPAPHYLNT